MNKAIRKKGEKEYKYLNYGKPDIFDIWWYGYGIWKYAVGYYIGWFLATLLWRWIL